MLRLYDRIAEAHRSRQLELLVHIYQLVKPFSYTEQHLLKFDLFALDSNIIERLETLLLHPKNSGNSDDSESSKTLMARSKT